MLDSPIEEIKNRLDIVEVIGGYIRLQKAGANFRALCPFHSEKKPSFFVSPTRQIWHCFGGCGGEGGDIFKFVMKIEGVEFGDALRILAQKAGVELKKQDPKLKTERGRLYEICELACLFFEKQLQESSVGKEAKNYLLGRGIKPESLKEWRLGYAPDVWQGLSDFLISRGYSQEEVQKAGLGLTSEKGSFFDRFRGRIIFPVFDLNSQVVGFGGRVFKSDDSAKYVNTPSTLIYDKSRILYGLDKAKADIRRQDCCILVEGYVDAIMVAQAGYQNVVATSGTALTSYQLKILKRYSENLLTAFDMDVAGDSATKKGIDLSQSLGFNIKVILMPSNSDPADIISKDPKIWKELVESAKSILEFYFQTTFSHFDFKTPEGKKEISKILLPVLKRIPNKIEQYSWIQILAKKLGVKEEVISEELKKAKSETISYELPEFSKSASKTKKEMLEERVVSLYLKSPQSLDLDEDYLDYFSAKYRQLLEKIKNSPLTFNNELVHCSSTETDLELTDLLNHLSFRAEIEEGETEPQSEIKTCLRELRSLDIKQKLDQISSEIKKAEERKDFEKVEQLLQEFNQLSSKL